MEGLASFKISQPSIVSESDQLRKDDAMMALQFLKVLQEKSTKLICRDFPRCSLSEHRLRSHKVIATEHDHHQVFRSQEI